MLNNICFQLTQWIHYADELQLTYVTTCVANGLCSVVAVIGNVMILLVILRNSSLHTPSYVLLCNLAISDLLVGLIAQPLYIALRAAEAGGKIDLSCNLGAAYFPIVGLSAWLSLLTLTAISFDRFLAVHLRLKYRTSVTVKKAVAVVVFLWVIAIVVGALYLLIMPVYFIVVISVIFISLFIISFNYFSIGRKLKHRHTKLQAQILNNSKQNLRTTFNFGRYKKTVTSMLYVYGVFLLCYLPYLCFSVALKLVGRTSTVQGAYLITATLVLSNSAFNPCLYYWRMSELRLAVKQLLTRKASIQRKKKVVWK